MIVTRIVHESGRYRVGTNPVELGFQDALSGRPAAGESAEYSVGYLRGRAVARAQRGECLVAVTEGARCRRCDTYFFGAVGSCGCEEPGPMALERGMYVLAGPHCTEEGARFTPHGELKAQIASGIPVLDADGWDISCQIQILQ